jgi:hypothetical protein
VIELAAAAAREIRDGQGLASELTYQLLKDCFVKAAKKRPYLFAYATPQQADFDERFHDFVADRIDVLPDALLAVAVSEVALVKVINETCTTG